jgi:23S rRNA (cytosine1962-C5)-methyltransferase
MPAPPDASGHSASLPAAPGPVAPDQPAARPVVRLRPKAGRRLLSGAPWAFADEIVMDRRTRAIAPGTVVRLEDAERRPLGTAAFNPASKIAARLLDTDPAAEIGGAWFGRQLARALALRARLFDGPFYRLVHAEGDGLPGIIVDRFGPAFVLQPNAAWADRHARTLAAALLALPDAATVILNGHGRARGLEGLPDMLEVIGAPLPGPVRVPVNGAVYLADLAQGQKTGFYYDQRENQAFAARLARGTAMLDLFAHSGGFALAALAAGAASALAVDSSAPALALAEAGARASGTDARLATRRADVFDALATLQSEGRSFGCVVADPPAFAPAKPALEAGLRAYEKVARLAAALVAPGGFLVLCSCSHAADLDRFREASFAGIARAGRRAQLLRTGGAAPDHPVHPALAETQYLKALFLRLDG